MRKLAALVAVAVAGLLAFVIVVAAALAGNTNQPSPQATAEIPPYLLRAYVDAASTCPGLPWEVLAAIGFTESRHADGRADPVTGDVRPPIVGPAIDGTNGNARIPDPSEPDGWAHAHGNMQFLKSTWARWGVVAPGRPAGADAGLRQRVRLDLQRRALSLRRRGSHRRPQRRDPSLQPLTPRTSTRFSRKPRSTAPLPRPDYSVARSSRVRTRFRSTARSSMRTPTISRSRTTITRPPTSLSHKARRCTR